MKEDTKLTHAGRDPKAHHGAVNTPVYHASTILFPDMESYAERATSDVKVKYGRRGTPTTFALEDAMTALEGGYGSVLAPSGLQAIAMALMAFVKAGDHVLVTDSTYAPTRNFCNQILADLGIEAEYYDPLIGGDIAGLMRANTRLVWTESPGSQTFDVQDIPAIVQAAHDAGVLVLMDNTWSGGYFFKPLAHGVDVAVHAATKYVVGHSDVMMGAIVCNEKTFDQVKTRSSMFGNHAGPDDVYLALRGLRTMGVRMPRHFESAMAVAQWLLDRPEVTRVMYPALSNDPGHSIWKRDFTGASGLFGFVIETEDRSKVAAMIDSTELFGIGSSWGGYESLLIPAVPENNRTATKWEPGGATLRIHVGLEDPDDLIADLEKGFRHLNGA
jgi:cystathionine beta-lyase